MSPALLRPACALLRHLPMLRLKRGLWVTRHADVVEVLTRDDDFGVDPAMAERFEQVVGPFLLGMDRSSAYEAQASLLRRVVGPNDLPRIRELVANHVTEVMGEAWSGGRIDVVWLARTVSVRLMGSYLGVPGPDDATMLGWVRTLFGYAFFARSAEEAMGSAGELRDYLQGLLTQRRATMAAGAHGYRGQHDDDVLTRLLELQRGDPSLEDNILRCNLAGLAVAAVEECAKAIVYVTDELLGRPTAHAEAREAALAGDMATLKRYVFEAMRFRPNNPTVPPRFCKRETTVAEGTRWEQRIPAGRRLVVFTFSAMFDEDAFHEPDHFRTDRSLERYLQFGHGLHTCFGRQIVAAVVPDVIAALLCLPGLRRAPGREGRITYDGFSPIRLVLESDEPVSCRSQPVAEEPCLVGLRSRTPF
ncbi:MAG: cytochrome P450 [Egibacteraceae bacterium]